MSSHPIIEVENLSKKYILSHTEPYATFRDALVKAAKKPVDLLRQSPSPTKEEFWALKDVSFSVQEGERLGIIGRNGAGKSTLLKILSQITSPTEGIVRLRGRIASLLEVGTGFHAELTGRENIFLNGAILGMKRKEIQKKFDEIVAFAEVDQFLDTPVKRYSSGMYVRLAFAVAAHLEPEILIVDEVLAVGDMQFQKKCLGKMKDAAQSGRTILFVSHNLGAVKQLCGSCILLEKGKAIARGSTQDVIETYINNQMHVDRVYEQSHNGSKKMNLRTVSLYGNHSTNTNAVEYDEDIILRLEYEVNHKVSNCVVWVTIVTNEGIEVLCTADYDLHPERKEERLPGYYQTDVHIPKQWLAAGTYMVIVGINSLNLPAETYDRVETIHFQVSDNGTTPRSRFQESARNGILQPYLDWTTIVKELKS